MLLPRRASNLPREQVSPQQDVHVKQLVTRLGAKLAKLARQQEGVAEGREEVLVERENLVQSAKRVREQRSRTADAEVAFMNVLRKHYNSMGMAFPSEIDTAYSKVDDERSRLGSLEAEHLETNEGLDAQEWAFTDLENELYQYDIQQLLMDEAIDGDHDTTDPTLNSGALDEASPIKPSAPIQYQVETKEFGRLRAWFKVLRSAIAGLLDATTLDLDTADLVNIESSDAVRYFDDVLTQLAQCEVRLQHLKSNRIHLTDSTTPMVRCASEPAMHKYTLSVTSSSSGKAYTEGAVSHHTDRFPVMHRVRDWLLDCLKQNSVDQMQYMSILQREIGYEEGNDIDLSDWEVLATQRWNFDTEMCTQATRAAATITSSSPLQSQLRVDAEHDLPLYAREGERHVVLQTPQLEPDRDVQLLEDLTMTVPEGGSPVNAFSTMYPTVSFDIDRDSDNSTVHMSPWRSGSEFGAGFTCSSLQSVTAFSMRSQAPSLVVPERCDSPHIPATAEAVSIASSLSTVMAKPNQQALDKPESIQVARSPTVHQDHGRTAADFVDIKYTAWDWSSELELFYVSGFTEDDNISEVMWLKPMVTGTAQIEEHPVLPRIIGRPDREMFRPTNEAHEVSLDLSASPPRCPWLEFYHMYIANFDPSLSFPNRWVNDADETGYHYIKASEASRFYASGKVFSTQWLLAVDTLPPTLMQPTTPSYTAKHTDQLHCQICFVAVRNKETYSQCLLIQYTSKPDDIASELMSDWGIIYTTKYAPAPFTWEHFDKAPLRVQPRQDASLPSNSRVYYGRLFRIEHKLRVREIGTVTDQDAKNLLLQCTVDGDQSCTGQTKNVNSIRID